MALEYVAKAVRRFWPVVLAFALLGLIGGQLLRPNAPTRYDSVALVLVVPPRDSGQANVPGDRYVASQLVALESPPLAAHAAELANVPLDEAQRVSFVQIPGTDVVRVIASSGVPQEAQDVANAYLDAYLEQGQTSGDGSTATSSDLDTSIAEVSGQLDDVDQRIQDAMSPFTEAAKADASTELPTIEQVAPAIATEREVLLDTYRNLLQQRITLEYSPSAPSGSQVIQRAELPTVAIAQSSRAVRIALPVLGLLLGVAAATILARTSRRVLDATEVSEQLGVPFATTLPHERTLRARSLHHVGALPPAYAAHVRELCVQAEAHGEVDSPLSIVVTGAQRVAGSSTVAAAMAARFGELGSTVVLLDLDLDYPDISRCFGVRGDGVSALIELEEGEGIATPAGTPAFTPTPLPNVTIVGRQPGVVDARPQRADLLDAMDEALEYADVVIVDTGPMLAAHSATALAQQADAIVLAVPVMKQDRATLLVIARQLAPLKARLLPVAMPRLKRSRRLPIAPAAPPAAEDANGELKYPAAS